MWTFLLSDWATKLRVYPANYFPALPTKSGASLCVGQSVALQWRCFSGAVCVSVLCIRSTGRSPIEWVRQLVGRRHILTTQLIVKESPNLILPHQNLCVHLNLSESLVFGYSSLFIFQTENVFPNQLLDPLFQFRLRHPLKFAWICRFEK